MELCATPDKQGVNARSRSAQVNTQSSPRVSPSKNYHTLDQRQKQIITFQIYVGYASCTLRFPCRFVVRCCEASSNIKSLLEDKSILGTSNPNARTVDGRIQFDEKMIARVQMLYDTKSNRYDERFYDLILMLISDRRPNQQKCCGRCRVNLADLMSEQNKYLTLKEHELEFCAVKDATLAFTINKISMNQELPSEQPKIQHQEEIKLNNQIGICDNSAGKQQNMTIQLSTIKQNGQQSYEAIDKVKEDTQNNQQAFTIQQQGEKQEKQNNNKNKQIMGGQISNEQEVIQVQVMDQQQSSKKQQLQGQNTGERQEIEVNNHEQEHQEIENQSERKRYGQGQQQREQQGKIQPSRQQEEEGQPLQNKLENNIEDQDKDSRREIEDVGAPEKQTDSIIKDQIIEHEIKDTIVNPSEQQNHILSEQHSNYLKVEDKESNRSLYASSDNNEKLTALRDVEIPFNQFGNPQQQACQLQSPENFSKQQNKSRIVENPISQSQEQGKVKEEQSVSENKEIEEEGIDPNDPQAQSRQSPNRQSSLPQQQDPIMPQNQPQQTQSIISPSKPQYTQSPQQSTTSSQPNNKFIPISATIFIALYLIFGYLLWKKTY